MASEALTLRGAAEPAARRVAVGTVARRLARIAFGAAIVLSPFRATLVLASRPAPPVSPAYTNLGLAPSELAIAATLGLWLLSLACLPRRVSLGPEFLTLPVAGLLALAWTGVPFSLDPVLSAFNAAKLLALAGLAVYALNEIESLAELALPLGVMLAIEGVVAVGQFIAQRSLGLGWLGEPPLDPLRAGVSVVATSGSDRLLRAYGLTEHPNILGGIVAFALPLVVFGVASTGRRAAAARAGLVALGAATLLVTFSRGAWLATAAAIVLGIAMLVAARRPAATRLHVPALPWRQIVLAGAVFAIGFVVAYGRYVGVRLGLGGPAPVTELMSTGERIVLAGATLGVIAAHPILGTGLATLPIALRDAGGNLSFGFQPAHVVLLDVAGEIGVAAALCYVLTFAGPALALLRLRRAWSPELVATTAALAAVAVAGLFDYYTWTWTAGRIWAWLVLGLWAATYVRDAPARPSRRSN